jgi:hypothetical protein
MTISFIASGLTGPKGRITKCPIRPTANPVGESWSVRERSRKAPSQNRIVGLGSGFRLPLASRVDRHGGPLIVSHVPSSLPLPQPPRTRDRTLLLVVGSTNERQRQRHYQPQQPRESSQTPPASSLSFREPPSRESAPIERAPSARRRRRRQSQQQQPAPAVAGVGGPGAAEQAAASFQGGRRCCCRRAHELGGRVRHRPRGPPAHAHRPQGRSGR